MSQRANWTLKFGNWRDILLGAPRLSGHAYEHEDLIQRRVYELMCNLTSSGAYRGIFLHPANELYLGKDKRKNAMRMAFAKSLGMIPGVTDWVLIWDTGTGSDAGVIELKTEGGSLSENQKHFRNWCAEMGIKWRICRSDEEYYLTLIEWGAVRQVLH